MIISTGDGDDDGRKTKAVDASKGCRSWLGGDAVVVVVVVVVVVRWWLRISY